MALHMWEIVLIQCTMYNVHTCYKDVSRMPHQFMRTDLAKTKRVRCNVWFNASLAAFLFIRTH